MDRIWRKSSYSSGVNSMCAEVAPDDAAGFVVRDSKAPGETLRLGAEQWRLLLAALRAGRL
ncbi:MAG TPA: DUF397 domain-containing protein [Actinophytocola sp.]|uniref:DUF397 domain-containing protein n=1 Tax=Actinophytocola sp. TaxID=1872138 RepID=UPI002DDD3145|nr:DUF397 domain-containing protein [Actinophytocola sp.]HEV2781158.1 DUF397 domain-containing protein [Actinophytocola sp.]